VLGFHRNQYRDFTACPPATFTGFLLAPDRGVINVYHSVEVVAGIAVLHGRADLMTPGPCGLVGEPQIMLELTGRGARGSGGYNKNGPKPVPQGLSRPVEDGMGGHRGLVATVCALVQGAGFNGIGPRVATLWAAKAIGPLAFDEIREAVTLGAKPPTELLGCH
jgi:hypothetical protein